VLTHDLTHLRNHPSAIVSPALDNERAATGAIGLDAEGFEIFRHRNPLEAAKLRRRQGKQAGMIARRRPETVALRGDPATLSSADSRIDCSHPQRHRGSDSAYRLSGSLSLPRPRKSWARSRTIPSSHAAVLAKPVVGLPGTTPEKLARLVGAPAAETALALVRLGELGLPGDWSPTQGLDSRQAETLRKMLLAVVSDPRLVLARLAEQLVGLRHARSPPCC